jgi:DNA-binding MarR family transcriptional regulator
VDIPITLLLRYVEYFDRSKYDGQESRLSNRSPRTCRDELTTALLNAGREYSTAAVMLHGLVAERFALSATDLKALDILQRLGPQPAGEIARHTGLATASVTSLIDRLEAKRFVRRHRDDADRRRVLVMLTENVDRSIAPLFRALNRRMLRRFGRYTDRELSTIRDFLLSGAQEMREEISKLAG